MAYVDEITDGTFGDAVFKSRTPVLVQFWAPWSKACRLADPPLEQALQAYEDAVRLARLNVEENPVAATVYGVRSIPLLVLFRQGEEIDRWAGYLGSGAIRERLAAALRSARGGAAAEGTAGVAE